MILTNRLFVRREPEKEAKSIYIFCEGRKREKNYFQRFQRIDSRINIEVYPLKSNEDNSPMGLYNIACECLIANDQNPVPKYELMAGDEVWFVIDTDQWGKKIEQLRARIKDKTNWYVAQSNPCFEVWLLFHQFSSIPELSDPEVCDPWRKFVSDNIPGGFDHRRHYLLVHDAVANASLNHVEINQLPAVGSTQVFQLGKVIINFCGEGILSERNKITSDNDK